MNRQTLYSILINGMFLPSEAKRIINSRKNQFTTEAQDIDALWKSGLIQKAIHSRINFVNNLRAQGWSDRAIQGSISSWYRGRATDSSTFSFLRREYQIPTKEIHTYKLAVRARARAMVGRLGRSTGIPYGKRIVRPSKSTLVVHPQEKFPQF